MRAPGLVNDVRGHEGAVWSLTLSCANVCLAGCLAGAAATTSRTATMYVTGETWRRGRQAAGRQAWSLPMSPASSKDSGHASFQIHGTVRRRSLHCSSCLPHCSVWRPAGWAPTAPGRRASAAAAAAAMVAMAAAGRSRACAPWSMRPCAPHAMSPTREWTGGVGFGGGLIDSLPNLGGGTRGWNLRAEPNDMDPEGCGCRTSSGRGQGVEEAAALGRTAVVAVKTRQMPRVAGSTPPIQPPSSRLQAQAPPCLCPPAAHLILHPATTSAPLLSPLPALQELLRRRELRGSAGVVRPRLRPAAGGGGRQRHHVRGGVGGGGGVLHEPLVSFRVAAQHRL